MLLAMLILHLLLTRFKKNSTAAISAANNSTIEEIASCAANQLVTIISKVVCTGDIDEVNSKGKSLKKQDCMVGV